MSKPVGDFFRTLWPSHNVLTLKLRQFFCLTNKQKSLLYQRILTFRLTIPIELLNRPYSLVFDNNILCAYTLFFPNTFIVRIIYYFLATFIFVGVKLWRRQPSKKKFELWTSGWAGRGKFPHQTLDGLAETVPTSRFWLCHR